jgi:hypothetical protein
MSDLQWWGYLHADGNIHVKRYFGDPKDYTTDVEGNDFVMAVVPPFKAENQQQAQRIVNERLETYYA